MITERMILGNNCIYNGDPKLTGLNRNVLIVGGSGSGKTVSFVEPALMEPLKVKKPNNKIVIIPAPFEPPVRSLRATLPAHQSHTFR